ncbi:MAG: 2-hydroxyacid dehydrogenase [Bacteriovoracia bacterium]
MKITVFDTHTFERPYYEETNLGYTHDMKFIEARLTEQTAILARGSECVCAFVNDIINEKVIKILSEEGIRLIALRSAGFNNVDLEAAARHGIKVVRVPEYSPYAVAEHAVALILCLNRKIHRASTRVHEGNFSLNGLVGFDLHGKTVGIIGTGKIGSILAKIMLGFGCNVLSYDQSVSPELQKLGAKYVELDELLKESDIISLHVPLNPETRHMIDARALATMKKGVMLINTGRGALIDTKALIAGLKSGHVGHAGLDVYEEEEGIFFQDLSGEVIQDDTLARLLTFPNVILTSHQAFLTKEALQNIADTTFFNIKQFENNQKLENEVCARVHLKKS